MEKSNLEFRPIRILSLEGEEFFNIFLHDSLIVYSPKKVSITFSASIDSFFKILNNKDLELPDMIFLCLAIPQEDGGKLKMLGGFDVLKQIKSDPDFKNIPVIVFSRYNDPELLKKAKDLGARNYLIKGECMPSDIAKIISGDYEEKSVGSKQKFFLNFFKFKNK